MRGAQMVAAHTFGSVLRGRDLDGLSVEEVLMPPGLAVPEHRHEGAQIYFLLEGEYAETALGVRHLLRPGGVWFRPPREPHANAVGGGAPALTLIVTIDERRFASAERRAPGPQSLHSTLLNEVRSELVREIREGDAAAALALEGWALLLLSRTQRLRALGELGAPEWLGDAVSFVELSFGRPLSLSVVAAHFDIHPATLAAAFRRFHRASVGEYIRELRLRRARTALVETRRPLKRIAVDAGFFDQAHLGRCFKRRFGVSRARYRSRPAPRDVSS